MATLGFPSVDHSRTVGTGSAGLASTPEPSSNIKMEKENTGRWTHEEHELFIKGLRLHNKQWKLIAELIQTRTIVQIRTHAQKYFQKLIKMKGESLLSDELEGLTEDVAVEGTSIKMKKKPLPVAETEKKMPPTTEVHGAIPSIASIAGPKPAPVITMSPKIERVDSIDIMTDTEGDLEPKVKRRAISSKSSMQIPAVGVQEQLMLCVSSKASMKMISSNNNVPKEKPSKPVPKKPSNITAPRNFYLDEGETSASECSTPVISKPQRTDKLSIKLPPKAAPIDMDLDMSIVGMGLDNTDWGISGSASNAQPRLSQLKMVSKKAVDMAISTQKLEPFNCDGLDSKAMSRESSFCSQTISTPEPLIVPDTSFNLDMDWNGMDFPRISPKSLYSSQWDLKIERSGTPSSATARSDFTSIEDKSPASLSSSDSSSSTSDDEIDDMDFNMMTSFFFDDDMTSSFLDDDLSGFAATAMVEGSKKVSPMLKNCNVKPSKNRSSRKRALDDMTDSLMESQLLDNVFDSYDLVF